MKITVIMSLIAVLLLAVSCGKTEKKDPVGDKESLISESLIKETAKKLVKEHGEQHSERISRGVKQTAVFWTAADGDDKEFIKFCTENYIADSAALAVLFDRLQTNFETIYGHFNKIELDLKRPIHLIGYESSPVDILFASYSPSAHLMHNFYENKIAFITLLNFPHYSLEEKEQLGSEWTRRQWAYARMGDIYSSRVPSELLQQAAAASTEADNYISNYNIYAGCLIDDKGETYFPKDMKLISHWNLRDELKSQYANQDGLVKQKMIFQVMNKIISQEIPQQVVNSDKYQWNPYTNKVFENDKEVTASREKDVRYEHLLNLFKVLKAMDPYNPYYPTYIKRKFGEEMEIPQKQVEELFVELVSSPVAKQVGELIQKRLGRPLEPFDIWYDGFKARSSFSEEKLSEITMQRYPNTQAYKADILSMLKKLGFNTVNAAFIAERIEVDAAQGAGHAWGAQMRSENAHLRTRIDSKGMDYKGYNIATHELGHNVEQTITLQYVDYWMLSGVPNTAFTEAWAFIFQKRDLELLGMKDNNKDKKYLQALDNFWSTYEIMGVSLVDMNVWKWLYNNPEASPKELKKAVIRIAKDIWNKYYAPVFGVKDQQILAVYSHMIDNPLYLSAYPLGHLIEFQIESQIEGKSLSDEMVRMLTQGKLIPQMWMQGAVGARLSAQPMIEAAAEAMGKIK